MAKIRWPFRSSQKSADAVALVGGRWWSPEEIREQCIFVEDGRAKICDATRLPSGVRRIDLDGLLVAPGLVDACHTLGEDCLPPLAPGPYTDRHRREEDIIRLQPAPQTDVNKLPDSERLEAGVLSCLLDGVTCVASPEMPKGNPMPLRAPAATWIRSLLWDKDPAKAFAKANGRPVLICATDGTSRAAAREMERLAEWKMLAPNSLIVGGAALNPADAARLASAGAWLVWRPIVDQFVLGQTLPPDVFGTPGLRILIGGGSGRDGGRGLLAALQAADRLGYLSRERLLSAATISGRQALQVDTTVVSRETSSGGSKKSDVQNTFLADLSFWDASTLEEAIFEKGRSALQMVIVNGVAVLCRDKYLTKIGNPPHLRRVAGHDEFFSVVDQPACFT